MDSSSVSGIGSIGPQGSKTKGTSDRANFSRAEFMNLMVAQLQNQDPTNPLDNSQFLQQMTSIQNLEAMTALTDGINNISKHQSMVTAGSLIGKFIVGVGDNGQTVSGYADRVSVDATGVKLVVSGKEMSLGGIHEIFSADPAGGADE